MKRPTRTLNECVRHTLLEEQKVGGFINDCVDGRKKVEAGEGQVDLILNAAPTTHERGLCPISILILFFFTWLMVRNLQDCFLIPPLSLSHPGTI